MSFQGLQYLLGRIPISEFITDYYEQKVLYVDSVSRDGFQSLFSRREAELVLWQQENRIPHFVRVDKNGELGDPPRAASSTGYHRWVVEKYLSGWTVILHSLQEYSVPVAQLLRELESFIGNNVYAVGFLTPKHSKGFLAHFDTPNVFIVQVEGSKKWYLYDDAVERPLLKHSHNIDPRSIGDPLCEFTLTAGDVLYIPGGKIHAAEAEAQASVHLTIGFHPVRKADILKELLAVAAEEDVALRRHVERRTSSDRQHLNLDQAFEILIDRLRNKEGLDKALSRSELSFVSSLRPLPDTYLESVQMATVLTPDDLVEKRPGTICHIDSRDGSVGICFPGLGVVERQDREAGAIRGPGFIEPALHFIANTNQQFRISGLPGNLSSDAKTVLVRYLIRAGLLRKVA